jgi:hypothetical protein
MDRDPTPAELLAKALDAMPTEDRTRVLTWLLNRSFHDAPSVLRQAMVTSLSMAAPTPHEATAMLSRTLVRGGEHQVVPIRLPAEQHSQLRDWCQEHGFTMATVVRGLVDRFLEERGLLHRDPDAAKE